MHTRTILAVAGLTALLLATFAAPAAADCGPGPVIISRKSALFQSLGATTNATLLPTQTVAITIGTSGCSSSGIVQMRKDAEAFVASNAESLQRDVARGYGPYLASLATLAGCPAQADADFARAAQVRFTRLTAAPERAPAAWLDQLGAGIRHEPALAGACRLFS